MTKLSRKSLSPEEYGHYINNLWNAFILANSKEDIRLLFKDLFTHTEYKMFAKRLEIARRLLAGEDYDSVATNLKVTSHTIAKISNILSERGEGLRKAVESLDRLEKKMAKRHNSIQKNLENPLSKKLARRTTLGAAIKVGVETLDKKLVRISKQRSALRELEI
jgi:uncharacterized protein YerC